MLRRVLIASACAGAVLVAPAAAQAAVPATPKDIVVDLLGRTVNNIAGDLLRRDRVVNGHGINQQVAISRG
jgi:hypothetical protein